MRQMIKIALFLIILLLITLLTPSIQHNFNIIFDMLLKIVVAFGMAYVSFPIVSFFRKLGLKNALASTITLLLMASLIAAVGMLMVPLIYQQAERLIAFFQSNSSGFTVDIHNEALRKVYEYFIPHIDNISKQVVDFFVNSTQNAISASTKMFTDIIITACLYVYLVYDFERLVTKFKKKLKKDSKNYLFFQNLNIELLKYLKALATIIVIAVVEYGIVYYLIGHPDWMILAALCAIACLIPYFGGIVVNVIALITSLFVSPELFFKVLACVIILPNIDGNIIYPMIYRRSVKISPIVLLPSLFIFGGLFGMLGIVLSIPLIITYKVAKKYYKDDVKALVKKAWEA